MSKRKIIKIDEEKCNGCGLCIPNCPEGAIQIIDKKARLISDLVCDGLGACLGHCPQGAITIEERQAEQYSERKVMQNIIKQGQTVIDTHLKHLKDHKQEGYYKEAVDFLKEKHIKMSESNAFSEKSQACACLGAKIMDLRKQEDADKKETPSIAARSRLGQWPLQFNLVSPNAPYLDNADLLIAADCVGFAYASLHEDLLKGKILLVGCPKFDDIESYSDKLIQILKNNRIKSITYAHMEVPCCSGLIGVIEEAIKSAAIDIPFGEVVISIRGERLK